MNQPAIASTTSFCPECLKTIDASIIEREGQYYLRKTCPVHGHYTILHPLDIPEQYQAARRIFALESDSSAAPRDLILYITERCNQRCPICYNDAGRSSFAEPSLDDLLAKVADFQGEYVHLSGGEPLLRPDISEIIAALKKRNFKVGIFSNGKLLAQKKIVKMLKTAGVDLVILQFDSMRDSDYSVLRGEPLLEIKKKAVEQCAYFHLPVYLFSVIVDGLNHDQIQPLFTFAAENANTVKILNVNPVWEICRNTERKRISNSRLYQEIHRQLDFSLTEFLECAELSHYFFLMYARLLQKKKKAAWVRQPPCAQRIYLLNDQGRIVSFGVLMHLRKDLPYLRKIAGSFIQQPVFSLQFMLSWCSFVVWLLRSIVCRAWFWRSLYTYVKERYGKRGTTTGPVWAYIPVFSFMVGVFHSKYDVDLEMIRKCTLYADMPDSPAIVPACIRQIYFERDHYALKQRVSE